MRWDEKRRPRRWDNYEKFRSAFHTMERSSKLVRPISSHGAFCKRVAIHRTDGMGLSLPARNPALTVLEKLRRKESATKEKRL
jgi:hypothetical protein